MEATEYDAIFGNVFHSIRFNPARLKTERFQNDVIPRLRIRKSPFSSALSGILGQAKTQH